MLIIGNDVIGLKVVSLQKGNEVGNIKDILFNTNSQKVVGFLVDEKGLLSDTCFLPIEDIHGIGADAITINSQKALQQRSVFTDLEDVQAKSNHYLTNTQVITESGNELGTVDDILFDAATGQIADLVISKGTNNLDSDEKKIPFSSVITIGKDNTIIKNNTEESTSPKSADGIKKALDKTENSLNQDVSKVETEAKDAFQNLTAQAKKKSEDIKEDLGKEKPLGSLESQTSQVLDVLQRKTENLSDGMKQEASQISQDVSDNPEMAQQSTYTHTVSAPDRKDNANLEELESGTYAVTGEINFDQIEEEKINKKKTSERR